MQDKGANLLGNALNNKTNLTELTIRNFHIYLDYLGTNKIGYGGITKIAESLNLCKNLTMFNNGILYLLFNSNSWK